INDMHHLFETVEKIRDRTVLVVIDETLCDDASARIHELRNEFPTQVICIAYTSRENLTGYLQQPLSGKAISSFLPMNMRLDIWLVALQLMINGGEYAPPDILIAGHVFDKQEAIGGYAVEQQQIQRPNRIISKEQKLTARENDVLRLVAKGYQNKLVAAELELSEHTIKLHMHNIIAKLGVSNRTEAAAMYFDSMGTHPVSGPAAS
ncbi:MAG: response regulator transcription factor, partial [Pseudomonadota bacterium]